MMAESSTKHIMNYICSYINIYFILKNLLTLSHELSNQLNLKLAIVLNKHVSYIYIF